MVEICIGDVRSLFKSNYVSRLTRSQVVAFEIGDATAGGPPRARRRERVAHLHTELNSSIRRPPLVRAPTKFRNNPREKRDRHISFRRTRCTVVA